MTNVAIAIRIEVKWPWDMSSQNPQADALDWLLQIVNTGLAESDDNRGASAVADPSIGTIMIDGIEDAL